jgi:hypothetical protein
MANKPRRVSDFPQAAVEALWRGNVIEAIKVVRQARKIGLKEAKDLVDASIASQPFLKKKWSRCLQHAAKACPLVDRISGTGSRCCISRDAGAVNQRSATPARFRLPLPSRPRRIIRCSES